MSTVDEVYILISNDNNVFKNLAFETALLNYISDNNKKNIAILFLWKNDNTIVIGKHQNPLKECNMEFVNKNKIQIARRITGGGAVYHDKGNINFSFISSKPIYDKQKNFKIIINAFKNLGINIEFSGRNDLLLKGRKFSGNAYYQTKFGGLHHGTILLTVNKEIISKSLTPNKKKLETKSVDSVKSRIVNISEIYPTITQQDIEKNIINAFKNEYSPFPLYSIEISNKITEKLYKKYSSKEWIYKDYLKSAKEISNYYPWGELELKILASGSKIKKINILSDTLETELVEKIEKELINIELKNLKSVFSNIQTKNETVLNDIYELINSLFQA